MTVRALATGCLLASVISRAEATSFEEYGPGVPVRAAEQLSEAACDVAVDLRGAVATVEVTQRIANSGVKALASVHRFTVPRGAAISGFSVKLGNRVEHAVRVPAAHRSEPIESAGVLGADPAVLSKIGDDEYQILAQPFYPGGELTLTTRYAVIATPRASALRLVLPGRVTAGKLAPCRGTVRVTPGPSATVHAIRIANTVAGNRSTAPFVLEARDVPIDVDLDVASTQPVVWQQSQALPDGTTASLLTVLGPRIKAPIARPVVLLIDSSRSMDLVGRHNVGKVIRALGSALPVGTQLEAILFDRTATRVFGDLRPATADNLAAIETTLAKRGAVNGSDLVRAFTLARQVIESTRGQPMVVVITDGVTGELPDRALIDALASRSSAVDVHAIVLDPARTRSPGAATLRSPVNLYGGAYVEVNTDDLDDALTAIDEWMRPSWLELAFGDHEIPTELRSGAGFTKLIVQRGAPRLALRGHGDATFTLTPRPGPPTIALAALAQPVVTDDRALAVLSTSGRIATNRIAMIAGGGRYDRSVVLPDPPRRAPLPPTTASTIHASAIARTTLERLFREQLHPKAHACYGRALQRNAKLTATVRYKLRMGRGEVTDVQLAASSGDAAFDACLVDAAYLMTPPLPDFAVNSDDQTIANYPLSFAQRADQPVVVLGDADSESPIDIDRVEGGVPDQRQPVNPDTKTPLGGMRPPKSP
ncbi:MAG: VWA domain-containing protein [Deltaproteobacteria bacterium]|nr:VWA domain-containing protein [Deltaproteobacteria bacterium]